jgi:hypothetical protein
VIDVLSESQAREIAKAECDRRGLPFLDEVVVKRGRFRTTVLTHRPYRGGNVIVRLHSRTGAVLNVRFYPR